MESIMKRSLTKECTKQGGKVVLLQGWVKRFVILEMLVFINKGSIRGYAMRIRKRASWI